MFRLSRSGGTSGGKALRPVACEMRAELAGPPEVVWRLITDWDRLHEWMLELSRLKVLTAQREGVGFEAQATIRIGGLATRDRVRVTLWEPPRRLAVDHVGQVSGYGEMLLTEMDGDRTYFVWIESLNAPLGILGWLGLRLFKPVLQRTFERDLEALAALVRAPSAGQTQL